MESKSGDIITVHNLVKKYGNLTAVDSISFNVKNDEIFGILGPNGAGKTSTLEMIEGIAPVTSGKITVDGIDSTHNPDAIKNKIGILLQENAFFDFLSIKEILVMFRGFYENTDDPNQLLEFVELKDKANNRLSELSGGQKQRFAISVSLINNPKIVFLDEPTTGLDPQSRRHMWDLINTIRGQGKTIIITTHYMDEAQKLCDRIAIMDNGKIITLDTPNNLIDQLIGRGFKAKKVEKEATLEDVFIDLTGKKLRE